MSITLSQYVINKVFWINFNTFSDVVESRVFENGNCVEHDLKKKIHQSPSMLKWSNTKFTMQQDWKDLNPRPLTNAPRNFDSTNAPKFFNSTNVKMGSLLKWALFKKTKYDVIWYNHIISCQSWQLVWNHLVTKSKCTKICANWKQEFDPKDDYKAILRTRSEGLLTVKKQRRSVYFGFRIRLLSRNWLSK